MGDLWIIASHDQVTSMVEWLHRNITDPRYIVHRTGEAIAIGFSEPGDATLFRIAFATVCQPFNSDDPVRFRTAYDQVCAPITRLW